MNNSRHVLLAFKEVKMKYDFPQTAEDLGRENEIIWLGIWPGCGDISILFS